MKNGLNKLWSPPPLRQKHGTNRGQESAPLTKFSEQMLLKLRNSLPLALFLSFAFLLGSAVILQNRGVSNLSLIHI